MLNTESGFSWPSTALVARAGCASAQLICVGLAPSAVNESMKMGDPTMRIFNPLRSAGVLIACLELEISRNPFSPKAKGTTPCFSRMVKISLPTSPLISASSPLASGVRNGRENRLSCLTCGDQLIDEPMARSMTPCRIAENSRVWSPPTRLVPGYSFTLMRPSVFCFTRSAQRSPALPQVKAGPRTVDRRYSGL